ncbi:MAG TPA: response regulator [Terriglobales bacterium]|nr:response regulator [Terriglobales bacterium]
MAVGFDYRILVVDDDPAVLDTSAVILRERGYEVRTASGGFAALAELRRSLPDVIISDLRMPNMSGFELLSVVRLRFPHIPVIAVSGEYSAAAPAGLIADTFLSKAEYKPEELFKKIADLLRDAPMRPHINKPDRAPVWVPRNNSGYFVVTCCECLRSFSIPEEYSGNELRQTKCIFCDAQISSTTGIPASAATIASANPDQCCYLQEAATAI